METEKMFGSFSPARKGTNLLGRERAEAPCSRAFWQLQAYEVGMPKNPLNAYKFAVNPLFSLSASLALIQRGIGRMCSLETLDLPGLARFVSDNPASSRRLPHQCQSCHLLTGSELRLADALSSWRLPDSCHRQCKRPSISRLFSGRMIG